MCEVHERYSHFSLPIFPADVAGSIGFSYSDTWVDEDDLFAYVEVSRLGGSLGEVTVMHAAQDGTAIAGVDFTVTYYEITWADGEMGAKVSPRPRCFHV